MTLTDVYLERCAADSDIAAHLPFLHDTVVRLDAQVVVELGVRYGNSTTALLAAVEQTGGHLWSVDPAPMVSLEGSWTLLAMDDLDPGALAAVPSSIGVLFIDTSHTYRHTLRELHLYGSRVREGGVILCHDTEYEMDGEVGFPVARALDAWCAEVGLSWTNRPGSFGLGVVEVPS